MKILYFQCTIILIVHKFVTGSVISENRDNLIIDKPIEKNAYRNPVILVPGDGGSQIYAKLDKPKVVHYFCDRQTDEYFSLWLNIALLIPFVADCWSDNMRLVYDPLTRRTHNTPGVHTKVVHFGNTTGIEFIDPSEVSGSSYYNYMVEELVKAGYKRGIDLRGTPYDFRKAPNELEDFYEKFLKLVEDTYVKNGKRKVVIICHSMGCPILLYQFNRKTQDWKDKHIKSFVTLGAPWGGAVKAMKAFASGDNLGVVLMQSLTIRQDERTFPSLAFLLPSDKFWNENETILTTGKKNYTTKNFPEFFHDINDTVGYNMWLDTKDLVHDLIPPNIETFCIHGYGEQTMEFLEYDHEQFPNAQPKVTNGDGDGTVNARSLRGCLRWVNKQVQPVHYKNFSHIEHMSMLSAPEIVSYIKSNVLDIHS